MTAYMHDRLFVINLFLSDESHIAFFRQKKKTTNSLSQDLTAVPSYMEKYTKHPVAIVLFSLLLLGCFAKQARCRAMDDLGYNKAFSAADPDCWRNRIGCNPIFRWQCWCCALDEKCFRHEGDCKQNSKCNK
ncbi:hypothetical protein EJB05_24944, partial [Eragrostis curvula]